MSLVVDEHRQYLSDALRIETFSRAVAALIRPGDVVVDLGSGTGFLGFLALRAGARRVYAIESTGMIEIARELARSNGFADRMVFVHRHSLEAVLPERADALISDLVGGMGFEAGLFHTYADAGRRMLKPGARVMPSRLTLSIAPVEEPSLFDEVQFWSGGFAGFDSSPVLRWATNTGYPRLLDAANLLSSSAIDAVVDPLAGEPVIRVAGSVTVDRAGTLHGLGGWFDAELAPGVRLTNAPRAAVRLNRRNVFFPLEHAVAVRSGDTIQAVVRIRPADLFVSWDVTIGSGSSARRERHSTLNGMLLSREDLDAHAPDSQPKLTARGGARRTVLELCDGERRLSDIEREVFRRHSELFPTAGDAQAFVAEVVARYAEQKM